MKRKWVFGSVGIVLVLALAAAWGIWSMGEARYHPGEVAKGIQGGLSVAPTGPLKEGKVRADGSLEWSLEVEPGNTIRGLARGEGSPIVVIHGGPGFPPETTWAGLDAFASHHRFWYPHQRGSGWSDRPVDRFPTQDFPTNLAILDARLGLVPQIADIERLRKALGVERIDLVGHSFGGLIACLYAVEFPQRTGRILLVAPASLVVFPTSSGGLYEEIRKGLLADRLGAYEAWLREFFDYSRLFQRTEAELSALNAGVIPYYLEAARGKGAVLPPLEQTNPALTGGWMMQAIFFSLGQRHDWRPALAEIRTPVSLVYGDADLSGSDDFEAYKVIPGLKMDQLSGGTHFVAADGELFPRSQVVRDALQ